MKFKLASIIFILSGTIGLSACIVTPISEAYWQRVDSTSALYLTGPKAQQVLDENIVTCVREIDELVRIGAVRKTMPADTNSEYHRALNASGDLSYYNTPTEYNGKNVAHKDFHDYESCMRSKGWERVRFVRYDTKLESYKTYRKTKHYRETGEMVDPNILNGHLKVKSNHNYIFNQ